MTTSVCGRLWRTRTCVLCCGFKTYSLTKATTHPHTLYQDEVCRRCHPSRVRVRVRYPFSNKSIIRSSNGLGRKDYLIAPSILSADFARLGEEVDNVLEAGADVVHFDVMDNHYVPNLTIGPMVCKALRDHGVTAPIDVHLMVSPVDAAIQDFIGAGASYITFHPEATNHVDRSFSSSRLEVARRD
ncbi:ribulose-phosphate 3-epimerase [Fragilaria crotonensis]|nr:ribulose-phosphate 3-epimerase [Fragilaria crotonensis]